jgi:hypothetical protein
MRSWPSGALLHTVGGPLDHHRGQWVDGSVFDAGATAWCVAVAVPNPHDHVEYARRCDFAAKLVPGGELEPVM